MEILLPFLFIPFFLLLWVGVTSLMARLGGLVWSCEVIPHAEGIE